MVKIDLVTGFLGSGKTTFIKGYARYLMQKGEKVCILENDFGAVNVDLMLLQELYNNGCGLEMVSGACDKDCHKRRFKTKLIAMAMSGYSRVVIEPSGIFDVDEFFDTLREEPLDSWYEIGCVSTIAAPQLDAVDDYLLASQAAVAGKLVFSHCSAANDNSIFTALERIEKAMKTIHSDRRPTEYYIAKPWENFTDDDYLEMENSGYHEPSFIKQQDEAEKYSSVYFMNKSCSVERLKSISEKLMADNTCGKIIRVKGFTNNSGQWYEINATKQNFESRAISTGQDVVIVIGEKLDKRTISEYFY